MKHYYLLFIVLLCTNSLLAQKRILFAASGQTQLSFVKNNNLDIITLFYQNEFIAKDGETLNLKTFEKFLDQKIPNRNATGWAVLNWEGEAFNILKKPSHKKHNSIKRNFIKVIRYAKELRPNIEWSFYGLPFRQYWHTNNEWKSQNQGIIDIFREMDFLAPSLYIMYLPNEVNRNLDENYIDQNIKLSLEYGNRLNKKVYPFIYHRNRTRKPNNINELASDDQWRFYVNRILNIKFEGREIDGIIWWNSERVIYSTRSNSPALKKEFKDVKDIESYQFKLFNRYYDLIKKYF